MSDELNSNVNYDDVDEYEEVQDALQRYEDSCARLIEAIARRDAMASYLKIAPPASIPELRECIAQWNSLIEMVEKQIETNLRLIEHARQFVRSHKNVEAFNKAFEPALLKYAEEHPEKRELIAAILSDDGKTH